MVAYVCNLLISVIIIKISKFLLFLKKLSKKIYIHGKYIDLKQMGNRLCNENSRTVAKCNRCSCKISVKETYYMYDHNTTCISQYSNGKIKYTLNMTGAQSYIINFTTCTKCTRLRFRNFNEFLEYCERKNKSVQIYRYDEFIKEHERYEEQRLERENNYAKHINNDLYNNYSKQITSQCGSLQPNICCVDNCGKNMLYVCKKCTHSYCNIHWFSHKNTTLQVENYSYDPINPRIIKTFIEHCRRDLCKISH